MAWDIQTIYMCLFCQDLRTLSVVQDSITAWARTPERSHSNKVEMYLLALTLCTCVSIVAKKRLTNLAHLLKLNQHCIDSAFMFFKMALQMNLTRGRKSSIIDTACLYLVCRSEGTPRILCITSIPVHSKLTLPFPTFSTPIMIIIDS